MLTMRQMKSKKIKSFLTNHRIFLIILLIFIALLSYNYSYGGITYKVLSSEPEVLINFLDRLGLFSPIMYVTLVALEVIIAFIPGVIFAYVGGVIYGGLYGGILLYMGNLIGSIVAFYLALKFGRKFVEKVIEEKHMKNYDKYSKKYGGFLLFLLKANPLTSSDIFNYAAGLSKISFRTFLLVNIFALIPMAFIQSYLGEKFIKTNQFLYAVFIIIGLFSFIFAFYSYYRIRK